MLGNHRHNFVWTQKVRLLGIWPSSLCEYLFPLGQIPITYLRIYTKQLNAVLPVLRFSFWISSGYHRAVLQSERWSVGMLRGIHALKRKGVGLFILGGFAISVRRRSDGTGRPFLRIFRVPFPYSLYVRVAICTSTSPRFCVFYICMNLALEFMWVFISTRPNTYYLFANLHEAVKRGSTKQN